jgi:hypothetical protein
MSNKCDFFFKFCGLLKEPKLYCITRRALAVDFARTKTPLASLLSSSFQR